MQLQKKKFSYPILIYSIPGIIYVGSLIHSLQRPHKWVLICHLY